MKRASIFLSSLFIISFFPLGALASGGTVPPFNPAGSGSPGNAALDVGVPGYPDALWLDCFTLDRDCTTLISSTTPYTILAVAVAAGNGDATYFVCNPPGMIGNDLYFTGEFNDFTGNMQPLSIFTSTMQQHCSANLVTQGDSTGNGIYYWVEYVPYDTRVYNLPVQGLNAYQIGAFLDLIAFGGGMFFIIWFFHKR